MWKGKSVSVVIASYREKNSIRSVIEDFFATGVVDEVIVVDNNAEAGSADEVKKTKARLLFEKKQGQGFALRTGMREASGDYVVLCEGDGSYCAEDLEKFLAYAVDFPVVLGTRTHKSLISSESAMFFLRRIADVLEGKLIELLFNSSTLTDVGCTYKLLRRDVIKKMDGLWEKGDSHFVTEMTLQFAARGVLFVEIPVVFQERVGESAVTGSRLNIVKWGIKLFVFIIAFWLWWMSGGLKREQ